MSARRSLPCLLAAASALVSCLLAAGVAPAQTWSELGPEPILGGDFTGRVASIAVSSRGANRYLVGAASGGAWHSRNGGRRWLSSTDALPILSVGAVAIDPNDDDVFYAGSGEANYAYHSLYGLGLYKSTDRGASWRVLAADTFAGRTFSRLVVSPADGDQVWAAVGRAGGTFLGVEGGKGHPGAGGPMGLYRSTDGGESWERLRRGLPKMPASDVDLDPSDPERVFASFGNVFGHGRNGIYRSTDGGRRFRKVSRGLPGGSIGRISLAIAPSDPSRIYALLTRATSRLTSGGFSPGGGSVFGLYRSTDGGDSWALSDPGNFMGQQGNYNSAIAVDPEDPDTFFLGGVLSLRSTDGGASYVDVTTPHVDVHDFAFDARGRLLAATDGGVFRSTSLGRSWSSLNRRLGLVQIYAGLSTHPFDPGLLLAGMQDNGSNLRTGPGNGWTHVAGGDGGYTAIHPTSPNEIFVEIQGTGNLFRSFDLGFTFVRSSAGIDPNDRNCFLPPFVYDPSDSSRLLYATHRIYESTDGGGNWRPISGDLTAGPPAAVRALVIAPSDSSVVYALTNDDRLLVSEDGGTNWVLRRDDVGGWPRVMRQLAVDPADAGVALAADARFGGPGLLLTLDRGATWSEVGAGLGDVPINAAAIYRAGAGRFLFAGTDAGVHFSSDDGASWARYGAGLPNAPVLDVVVDTAHGRLVASTLGRGAWSAPLPAAAPRRWHDR